MGNYCCELHGKKPTPFHERTDLVELEIEVDDSVYRSWSTKRRDANEWLRLIRAFSQSIGRLPDGIEALQLIKET